MATRGRKTKRTPEVEKIITDALSLGLSIDDACAYARINQDTFHTWKKEFSDFSESVTRAESVLIMRSAARMAKEVNAPDGDWRAALEVLKRRRRAEWGDSLDLRKLSDEELIDRAKSLIGGAGTTGAEGSPG